MNAYAWIASNCKFAQEVATQEPAVQNRIEEWKKKKEEPSPHVLGDWRPLADILNPMMPPFLKWHTQENGHSETSVGHFNFVYQFGSGKLILEGAEEYNKTYAIHGLDNAEIALNIAEVIRSLLPILQREQAQNQWFDYLETNIESVVPGLPIGMDTNGGSPFCFDFVGSTWAFSVYINGYMNEDCKTVDLNIKTHTMREEGFGSEEEEEDFVVASPDEALQHVKEFVGEQFSQVQELASDLYNEIFSWHKSLHVLRTLEGRLSAASEKRYLDAKATFYQLSEGIIPKLLLAIDNWLDAHKWNPEHESMAGIKSVQAKLSNAADNPGNINAAAEAITLAISIAHRNGQVLESLGLTKQQLDSLHVFDTGPWEREVAHLAWIRNNCKFAQGVKQTYYCRIYNGSHELSSGQTSAVSEAKARMNFWWKATGGSRIEMTKLSNQGYDCECTTEPRFNRSTPDQPRGPVPPVKLIEPKWEQGSLFSWMLKNLFKSSSIIPYDFSRLPQQYDIVWSSCIRVPNCEDVRPVIILRYLDNYKSVLVSPTSGQEANFKQERGDWPIMIDKPSHAKGDFQTVPVKCLKKGIIRRMTPDEIKGFKNATGFAG